MATVTGSKLQNFIGGEFVDPAEGQVEDVINPATGEVIAQAPLSGAEDVDRAVAAARRAFETSRPTTHGDPTYEVDGIIHYCVTNMPGAVPITSTYALTNATLPYVMALADHGVAAAARRDPGLKLGVNVAAGKVTHPAVAEGVAMDYTPVDEVLGIEPPAANGAPGADGAGATASQAMPGAH